MRALALVLVATLGACKSKSKEQPVPRDAPRPIDAAIDWARCEAQLKQPFDLYALVRECSVCDFESIFDWNRPPENGGVRREKLLVALQGCSAFCNGAASDRFMNTLDDARGKTRTPWRLLGAQCKEAVGQEPGAERFMTDALFALDRIARSVAARGGAAAEALAKYEVVLPPLTVSGIGPGAPNNQRELRELTPAHLTVSFVGGKIYVGKTMTAKLDANGVHVLGVEAFPGVETTDPNAELAKIGATEKTPVVVFAAPSMPATELVAVLAKRTVGRWRLGTLVTNSVGTWPHYGEINTDLYGKPLEDKSVVFKLDGPVGDRQVVAAPGSPRPIVDVGPKATVADVAELLVAVHAGMYTEVALVKAKR